MKSWRSATKFSAWLLVLTMLLSMFPVSLAAEVEPLQEPQTAIELDFSAVGGLGYSVTEFTEEEDGWSYDTENSHDVTLDFYRYSANADLAWDYRCLRVRQTASGGLAVLNVAAPVAGTYTMELTYGRGNNANQTKVEVGGTVTSYFAYAQYGAEPETVVTEGVRLTSGSNPISMSVNATSQIFIKKIVFNLVEADPVAPEIVKLDFNAAAAQGRAITDFTEEKDGWAYDASQSANVKPIFFQYNKNGVVWDYSCLRFTQTALGGKGAVRFTAPTTGLYDMTVTYCTGNSGNQTELLVGGTTTSYHAWATWGAAPKTAATKGVLLTKGSNLLTVSCPTGTASYMMLKDVTFTLVQALPGDGKADVRILSDDGFVMKAADTAGISLRVEGETALDEPMDLTAAEILFESTDTSVLSVTEDGHVTPVGEGCALVQVTVTLPDGTVYKDEAWVTVTNGKTGSTYYTAEKREAALYNANHTEWGKGNRMVAVRNANKVLRNIDIYYDMITMEGLPRAESAGMSEDPLYQHCPMCNVDLIAKYGNYGWLIDPINEPWKIICPACESRFPSNDFASYYASGLDAQGFFHADKADSQYLVNELYPEKGAGWGVDDGFGWVTGEVYTNAGGGKSPRIYAFVAVYNGMGIWSGQNTNQSIDDALNYLRDAYLYTGDAKYGRAGAILIDRVADAYATMSLTDHVYKKPRNKINYLTVSTLPKGTIPYGNNQGTYFQGKIMGCITESNFLAKDFLKAYDAFFPMFDDPEVIAYLANRAKEHGLVVNGENPKDTPAELRENGINGLVHEISEGVRNRDIWGNFGLAESTMALAAVILDTDEQLSTPVNEPLNMPTGERRKMNTDEMIAWLVEVGTHAHANMLDEIIKSISRDGFGDEVSPQYHLTWQRNLIDFADAMDGYDGYPGVDLYRNPRFIKMLTGALAITAGGNTTLQNGDSGTAGGVRIYLDQNAIARAFRATGRVELAQALYFLNGNQAAGIVGDMFDREAESLAQDVQAVIDEYGSYDVNKSVLLAGYGQALLKFGTNAEKNQGLYGLWFGRLAGGHGNRNALDLSLFAYGLNFAPAFGYPQAANSDYVRSVWERGTISRNTVVINDQSQKNYAYYEQFPNTEPYHFDDTDYVKVMDTEAKKAYPDLAEEYRRTVVMVQGDDDTYYAVDFFRVAGGSTHLYSFHAAAEAYPESDSIETVAQGSGTYAGANVAYGAVAENGYSFLYDVETDKTPANNFYLDYTIVDHRNLLKDPSGLHLRLNMLSTEEEPFTEVTFAKGNPPAKGGNPEYYPYSLIRKNGSDNLFTAVYEPYRNDRYLNAMELVDVTVKSGTLGADDRAAAVKITRADGKVEYIVYCTNYDVLLRVDDRFDFSGFVGVVTYESETETVPTYRYGMDATNVAGLQQPYGAVTGEVVDFTHDLAYDNFIEIKADQTAEPEALVGRVIYVTNDGSENGAYTIEGVTETEDTLILHVGDQNMVRALKEPANTAGGFIYNIAEGQSFRIPMSVIAEGCVHEATSTTYKSLGNGMHDKVVTCKICGEAVSRESMACSDKNKDGKCDACRTAMQVAPTIEKFTVAGCNMTLGNELELNIFLPKATVDAYGKELTATVTHHAATGDVEYVWSVSELPLYSGTRYYKASVRVAAAQMTDLVDIVVTDEDGNVYNNDYTTSVRTYVTNNIDKQKAAAKTLLVDMVNYGAAAQDNFKYRQGDYANANLTEAHKALATPAVECENILEKGTNYVGSNLSLQDRILLNFFFKAVDDAALSKMYATVAFTGVLGNEVEETVKPAKKSGYTCVAVDQIVLADAVCPVTVTVYNADGTVYGFATDSVESYNARQNPNGTNALYTNIMKFAASALAYKNS